MKQLGKHVNVSEPSYRQIREIMKCHRPWGWRIEERGPLLGDEFMSEGRTIAQCFFDRKFIYCPDIVCRRSLYIFLHECGHVHHGDHHRDDLPLWQIEYEAEQYAIQAIRGAGLAMPRDALQSAKAYVRGLIATRVDDEWIPRKIWRWANLGAH